MDHHRGERFFPEESGDPSQRDGESGEIATREMCVLRRRPKTFPAKFHCGSHCVSNYYFRACPLFREQTYSQRLRIQENMTKIHVQLHQRKRVHCCQPLRHADINPVLFTYLKSYDERPLFRVPEEFFRTEAKSEEEPSLSQEAQIINIWEEFIHGTSVLNKSFQSNTRERDKTLAATLQSYLSQFLSQTLVSLAIYLAHFIIYFFSMYFYNLFWSFLGYILLDGHIRIHERAYKHNVNVKFGGSAFQGPAYILVRDWCEHCQQAETERMSIRLMEKMKRDIILHEKCHV
ncbi:uncharacterized protein [Macrobrachium rosenbergii]|uniref:uncharacterized protein n=1 Tax=Macrobrachium rosenbergii TaxID=79674 RepID=UPI0034D5CF98